MPPERTLTKEELRLVEENVALAKFLFKLWYDKLQKRADYGIDPSDLLSQAYYGLIRAALRYRSYGEENGYSEESIALGTGFSVFARKSIIGQMLDYLRKVDHVHTLVRNDYKALQAEGLGSTDKTVRETADSANITFERAQKVIALVQSKPVYLDDSLTSDSEQTVGEQIPHDQSVESSALEASLRFALVEKYDSLEPLQRFVIAGKYYAELELPDLAKEAKVSLTAIRRAHAEALLAIHEAFVIRLSD